MEMNKDSHENNYFKCVLTSYEVYKKYKCEPVMYYIRIKKNFLRILGWVTLTEKNYKGTARIEAQDNKRK